MRELLKKYSNGEITIVWKPNLCIHSSICWSGTDGLMSVFNPRAKTWVNINGASTERIIEQINKCPSGALSYYLNEREQKSEPIIHNNTFVELVKDGPLIVRGGFIQKNSDGQESNKKEVTAFCRCGCSTCKPYCDGSHVEVNFKG